MSEVYLMDFARQGTRNRGTWFDVIFFVIVLLASGFSSYTTYLGFAYDIPMFMAFVLAIIIGLGLFAVNFLIRDARRHDTGLTKPFIAFFIIFVFSFISNTNAIYTFFLQRDIVGQTQEEAWRVFDSESTKVLTAIGNHVKFNDLKDRRTNLAIERNNLRRQITDPRNLGLGPIARDHLDKVNQILGIRITPLQPPPETAPMSAHQTYAEQLDQLIEKHGKEVFAEDPGTPLEQFSTKIQQLQDLYWREVQKKNYDSNTTDLMKRDLDQITIQGSSLMEKELRLQEINTSSDEIGSFQYTWPNFVNWINPAAIILSVLLGTLLDVMAPLFSVLLYRSDEAF